MREKHFKSRRENKEMKCDQRKHSIAVLIEMWNIWRIRMAFKIFHDYLNHECLFLIKANNLVNDYFWHKMIADCERKSRNIFSLSVDEKNIFRSLCTWKRWIIFNNLHSLKCCLSDLESLTWTRRRIWRSTISISPIIGSWKLSKWVIFWGQDSRKAKRGSRTSHELSRFTK